MNNLQFINCRQQNPIVHFFLWRMRNGGQIFQNAEIIRPIFYPLMVERIKASIVLFWPLTLLRECRLRYFSKPYFSSENRDMLPLTSQMRCFSSLQALWFFMRNNGVYTTPKEGKTFDKKFSFFYFSYNIYMNCWGWQFVQRTITIIRLY